VPVTNQINLDNFCGNISVINLMITAVVSINFLSSQVDSVIGYVKKFSLVELSLKKY
jgi:hypothetical protein